MAEITGATGMARFDPYTWYARVTPVFIVLLPLGISVATWFPGEDLIATVGTMSVAPFLLAALAAQFGRRWGKEKQESLWKSWGGPPTIQLLRHKDTTLSPPTRARYHKKLQALLPEYEIPTREMEEHNPQAADQVYEACVKYLINHTRDKERFPLLHKENASYGFLRNLWGMKPLGLTFALFGLVICGVRLWTLWENGESVSLEIVAGSCICLGLCAIWQLWISPDSVRVAANAYAERLLETCDHLERHT